MFRLFTKHQALILTLFFILSGCGSDSASTPTGSQGNTTSCPVGRFIKSDYFGSISFSQNGSVHIVDNNIKSAGYATCLDNTLVLTIHDVSKSIDQDPEANGMQTGTWQCEAASATNSFVIYCPPSLNNYRPGNIYRSGIEYFSD